MVRRLRLAAVVVALALPAWSQAQQVELQPPVLTIDADRLLAESAFGRGIAAEVEAAVRELTEENRRIEAELLAEERMLTDRRSQVPPEQFRVMAEAFDDKVGRLRAEQDEKERALAEIGEAGRQRFFEAAVPILSDLVRERGALVLLDRREVFLSADAIDITTAAIARIDAALPAEPAAE